MLIDEMEIDVNYAENVVRKNHKKISMTKLRTLMSPVNNLYTQVQQKLMTDLTKDIIHELEYIKVKFAYEAGRESEVKTFIKDAKLNEYVDEVINNRDRKTFIAFCRYFEALVAYTKFYEESEK